MLQERRLIARMTDGHTGDRARTLLQVLAIFGMILMLSIIFFKGYTDVMGLAREYSGASFWQALGRYLFRNLAG